MIFEKILAKILTLIAVWAIMPKNNGQIMPMLQMVTFAHTFGHFCPYTFLWSFLPNFT
jgi:hypothetical protein